MTGDSDDGSDAGAGEGDENLAAEADLFELVSDETRLAILRELVAYRRETSPNDYVGFADLRKRVGRRDSANFNYHLDRLVGRFVEKADEGYRITFQGASVVSPLLAGTYRQTGRREFDPAGTCPFCDKPLTGFVEEGLITVTCANDHPFRQQLPPGVTSEQPVDDLLSIAGMAMRGDIAHVLEGLCPLCYGEMAFSVETDPPAERVSYLYLADCTRCGQRYGGPPEMFALGDMSVVTFYRRHGIDVTDQPYWELGFPDHAVERVATDPTRFAVDVCLDGDCLRVYMDEQANIVETERPD